MSTIWLIGSSGRELDQAASAILSQVPGAALFVFHSPASALASREPCADLVLIHQNRPKEYSRNEVRELIGSHPLARFVVSLGPWCASSARSEQLWPEGIMVPHWAVEQRLRHEAAVLDGRRHGSPLTAGRDEVLAAESETAREPGHAGFVVVRSPDRSLAATLEDAVLAAGGVVATEEAALSRGGALLWDVDPLEAARLRQVSAARCAWPLCRIVALTAVPMRPVASALRRAGADLVLSKPSLQSQLAAAITVAAES
jgi:hypothetical protein